MTSAQTERAPLWWYKWWAAIAWVVCESLGLLDIGAPTSKWRTEFGNVAQFWCAFVHSPLESAAYSRELDETVTVSAANSIVIDVPQEPREERR